MKVGEDDLSSLISGAESRFHIWHRVIHAANIRNMVEVGVWMGEYAELMLRNCAPLEKYYMIDPWATLPDWNKPLNVESQVFDDVYAQAMVRTDFAREKRIVLRGKTSDVIDEIADGSLDFAYIDGDHTLRGITIDLMRLWPKIREGAFIGGDDFDSNPWQHDIKFEPTLVCPYAVYFAEAMRCPIVGLPHKQFLIQKLSDTEFSFDDLAGEYSDLSLNKLPPQQ